MAQFQKGQSGNKSGRPKGSTGKWSKFTVLMEPHVPAVIEMLVDEAINEKNMTAAKLILERVFPADVVKMEETLARIDALQNQLDEMESRK